MENEYPESGIEETKKSGRRVVMSTKPVKLAELARIVQVEVGAA
jgi:hypothetical protein